MRDAAFSAKGGRKIGTGVLVKDVTNTNQTSQDENEIG